MNKRKRKTDSRPGNPLFLPFSPLFAYLASSNTSTASWLLPSRWINARASGDQETITLLIIRLPPLFLSLNNLSISRCEIHSCSLLLICCLFFFLVDWLYYCYCFTCSAKYDWSNDCASVTKMTCFYHANALLFSRAASWFISSARWCSSGEASSPRSPLHLSIQVYQWEATRERGKN